MDSILTLNPAPLTYRFQVVPERQTTAAYYRILPTLDPHV